MPTTSNFGWTTPADTDLVKDGAAAIRTLGNGVDSSFVDLKGGTTGQVLTKASGTDLDFNWTTTAGSPLTTKGDLYGFSTVGARIPIGANGTVLTADSAEALGLKWAAPAGATFVGVQVYNSTAQSAANGADFYPDFDSESWDTNSFHSTSTNISRLTVPSGQNGKYMVYAVGGFTGNTTGYRRFCFSVNRTSELFNNFITPDTGSCVITFSGVLDLVATDYVEILTTQTSGGALNYLGGANYSSFGMYKIG